MKNSLICISLLLLAGSAGATSYYVSDCGAGSATQCKAGRDGNSGTDQSTPLQTCKEVARRFPTLAAGDQVLFARGSAQTACSLPNLVNQNSRKSNPIVLGAYTPTWAPANSANPILRGAISSYTLELQNTGFSTHDEGYVIQDLHFIGQGTAAVLPAIFMSNDVDNVTIRRVEIEQYRGGIQCNGGTNAKGASSDGLSEHMVIRDSNIHHNRGMGILTSCNATLIEGNTFDNNGVGMFDHHIYLDDSAVNNVPRTTTQITVRGNTLTNSSTYSSAAAATPTPGGCGGVAIVVHGLKDGVTIENNLISEPIAPTNGSCWGIAADVGGYGQKEGFTNVVIRGNTVINYAVGIGVGMCDTCTIESNNIYSEFRAGAQGINAPAVYYRAALAGNVLNNNLTIRSNSVYIKYPNYESVGIRLMRDGSNHTVASNLIYFGAGSTGGTTCFTTTGLTPSSFTAFDHNLCHFSGTSGKWDSTRTTIASQQAAGLDAHSLTTNPLIATPIAPSYSLPTSTGSPAIKNGHPSLSSKLANGGVKRGATPDIGAFQFGGSVVVPSSPTSVGVQ